MSDPYYEIVVAASDLKRAAPREYEKLVDAFKVLEERSRSDLIAAEPNVIFASQGKAWLVTQLRTKLENCFALRERK